MNSILPLSFPCAALREELSLQLKRRNDEQEQRRYHDARETAGGDRITAVRRMAGEN